jgi:hypothetical protein
MISSNLTTFERNVCRALAGAADGYGASDQVASQAEELFLRFAPRDRLQAEAAALEWVRIGSVVDGFVAAAMSVRGDASCRHDVLDFFARRFQFLKFPQSDASSGP